jgi:hypothetical protein
MSNNGVRKKIKLLLVSFLIVFQQSTSKRSTTTLRQLKSRLVPNTVRSIWIEDFVSQACGHGHGILILLANSPFG